MSPSREETIDSTMRTGPASSLLVVGHGVRIQRFVGEAKFFEELWGRVAFLRGYRAANRSETWTKSSSIRKVGMDSYL